jgi:hypothetical protein
LRSSALEFRSKVMRDGGSLPASSMRIMSEVPDRGSPETTVIMNHSS